MIRAPVGPACHRGFLLLRLYDKLPFFLSQAGGRNIQLTAFQTDGPHVMEGVLRLPGTEIWFPILSGVPSFLTGPLRPDLTEFATRHGLPMPADQIGDSRAE